MSFSQHQKIKFWIILFPWLLEHCKNYRRMVEAEGEDKGTQVY